MSNTPSLDELNVDDLSVDQLSVDSLQKPFDSDRPAQNSSSLNDRDWRDLAIADESQWQWHHREGQRWLTCRLLESWPHAFSSRHSYPHKPDTLSLVQLGLEGAMADWTTQVHGDRLVWFDEQSNQQEDADAVATERRGGSVWVRSADCVPVLIAHPHRVAAIHSGWRGTAAEIVPQTALSLCKQGASVSELAVAIGPAISGPIYQVSQEVGDRVVSILQKKEHPEVPPVTYRDEHPDKVRVDLRAAIVHQLLAVGVKLSNICLSPHCTWSDDENFFSYRRIQKPPTPIQWSGIGLHSENQEVP